MFPCGIYSTKEEAVGECNRIFNETIEKKTKELEPVLAELGAEEGPIFKVRKEDDRFIMYGDESIEDILGEHICRGCCFFVKGYIIDKRASTDLDGMFEVFEGMTQTSPVQAKHMFSVISKDKITRSFTITHDDSLIFIEDEKGDAALSSHLRNSNGQAYAVLNILNIYPENVGMGTGIIRHYVNYLKSINCIAICGFVVGENESSEIQTARFYQKNGFAVFENHLFARKLAPGPQIEVDGNDFNKTDARIIEEYLNRN